ncbi:hypothetical protein FB107DRAFT_275447 [Schizophyllum commune]
MTRMKPEQASECVRRLRYRLEILQGLEILRFKSFLPPKELLQRLTGGADTLPLLPKLKPEVFGRWIGKGDGEPEEGMGRGGERLWRRRLVGPTQSGDGTRIMTRALSSPPVITYLRPSQHTS